MFGDQRKAEANANNGIQQESNAAGRAPSISLPKGGGALRGMGEKFGANPVTGTGSMTVPIATSPSRSGFGPQLTLSYDSGAGNGHFGLGWSLSLPAIARKTDKGLARYEDADESDVYVLSGSEDLVPVLELNSGGAWVRRQPEPRTVDGVDYSVDRYRPRIEGLFARIERWTRVSDGDICWRSISKDNITTWYGKTPESRIADPADPSRVFSWLICQSYDDKGNAIVYHYAEENDENVDFTQANERNRVRGANQYLKRIQYGNRTPNRNAATWEATDPTQLLDHTWMFEVVFDYGEGHYAEDKPDAEGRIFARAQIDIPPDSHWPIRKDPFSTYRAGFEVRTYRLCRRVLMFHHFPDPEELGTQNYLVRATEFGYRETPIASFITSVTQSGFRLDHHDSYLKRSLPRLEFEYSEAIVQQEVQEVDAESLENLPAGGSGSNYQWLDLDGEGLQCVLAEQDDAWYYKRNVSPITFTFDDEGKPKVSVRFEPVTEVARLPSFAETPSPSHQFLDLAGDGQLDCVVLERPTAGFFERTEDQDWEAFRPLPSQPNIDSRDANLRFVDLTGDGHADILITEHECLTFYPSLGEDGFGPAIRIPKALDEEEGPAVVFADGTQSIFLADMSGDGLTDIVRIRDGEVCYWPSLGYGRFGGKVTMDRSPRCESQDQYDPRRVRLADIDGSGVTDIIYLAADGVRLYFNQSGNAWSDPEKLAVFPQVHNLSNVQALDLLGNGTACLVWTSPLPGDARRSMRYVDLMGGLKPHLLVLSRNNLGAETRVFYAPSTKFYLADREAGQPWITRLGFPVHVVERIETYDRISRNRFVSRYAYHHGYFDGDEREFRGFGMVEQFDTEEIGTVGPEDASSEDVTNWDAASFVPPVLTKTWFHTGIYLGREHVSDFFAGMLDVNDKGEYYREPGLTDDQAQALLLDDTVLPEGLSVGEEREACRALKGAMLRQEVYGLDGTPKAVHPYTVTEQNFTIEKLQPRGPNQHAVFFTHPREALSYHYERNPQDPRIGHALTLEVDDYGNVLKFLAIGYGRRKTIRVFDEQTEVQEIANPGLNQLDPQDQVSQTGTLITYTENRVAKDPTTDAIDTATDYRAPSPCETRTYELTGFTPENGAARFSFDEWTRNDFALLGSATEIHYEEKADTASKQKRLIEHVRTLYRNDTLSALLPLGELHPLALPGESYKLAFTPGLITKVYQRPLDVVQPPGSPAPENLLTDLAPVLGGKEGDHGGYVDLDSDGHWWIPSGRVFYDPAADDADPAATSSLELTHAQQHFFLPRKFTDPFAYSSTVDYDTHDLLVTKTEDAAHNIVIAHSDYRVLQPRQMTDPNGNGSEAAFDALGMVVATAVKGKEGEDVGDLLEDFDADPTLAALQSFVANPQGQAASLLGKATMRIVYDLDRFGRCAQLTEPSQPPFAATLARETHLFAPGGAQTKIQVGFSYSDGFGREMQKKIQAEAGDAPQRQPDVPLSTGDIRPGDLVLDADGKPIQEEAPRRWVGTGRTVFNNKGKPVRQYEPFLSATHLYEEEPEMTDTGVSPVLFYDPVERVVARLHPNHAWEKTVFDPWLQRTWDVIDTLMSDPNTDTDVGPYFTRLPNADYLPTWYTQRTDVSLALEKWPGNDLAAQQTRANEKAVAEKAAAHADTPTSAHYDTLGRTFLTVAHNRFKYTTSPAADPPVEEFYSTRTVLDIEGNQREVIDAKDRIVMRYHYDMLGDRIHQASMEAGERWMLNDASGEPIRAWDSRGHNFKTEYDSLRRPLRHFVHGTDSDRSDPRTLSADIVFAKVEYGEGQPKDVELNLRGRIFRSYDGAGVVTNMAKSLVTGDDEAYDFKGNLLQSARDLLSDYKGAADWKQNLIANDGTFTSGTTYDALNRPTTVTAPDSSIYRPAYNDANLLDKVDVNLHGATANGMPLWTPFVTNIDYNAKGQRTLIRYANSAETNYEYDEDTFRLTHLKTARAPGLKGPLSNIFESASTVQDLSYTYDPAGNIVRIEDAALSIVFFNQQQVDPVCDYAYDAIYRLIEASGREHIGQTAFAFEPAEGNYRDYPFAGLSAHPNDLQALRNYSEQYEYDAVGNFVDLVHREGSNVIWTRGFTCNEMSLLESTKQNNRLSVTTIAQQIETYAHEIHGNMTKMPQLPLMQWDFKDQLSATSSQVTSSGTPETTFYVYDASGERVRKVTERQSGARKDERIYLGGFEIYREYNGNGGVMTFERETLHVMDDKQRIALVETQTVNTASPLAPQASVIRYQLSNHLGSASLELDKDGGLISYEEYQPYGTTAYQAMNSAAEMSLKRYRYTGKERDEETGLYYQGARYYAPWLGRWTAADPIALEGGVNMYAYVQARPTTFSDPNGTDVGPKSVERKEEEERQQALVNSPQFTQWQQRRIEESARTSRKTIECSGPAVTESSGDPSVTASAVAPLGVVTIAEVLEGMEEAATVEKLLAQVDLTGKAAAALADAQAEALLAQVDLAPAAAEVAATVEGSATVAAGGTGAAAVEGSATVAASGTGAAALGGVLAAGGIVALGVGAMFLSAELMPPPPPYEPDPLDDVFTPLGPHGPSFPLAGETPAAQVASPPDEIPQMWVGGLRRWTIVPGESNRGVTEALRREITAWAAKYGTIDGPPTTGRVHAGHTYGRSHVFTLSGQPTQVAAQTAAGNLGDAADERRAAEARRAWNSANPNGPNLPVRRRP